MPRLRASAAVVLAGGALAVGGCRSVDDADTTVSTVVSARMSTVDGPVLRYPFRGNGEELDAPIWGTLELDDGCLYVERTDIGQRGPIVWPYGTAWDAATDEVVLPNGEHLELGAAVYGAGGFYPTDDVDQIVDAAAEVAARACEGGNGYVAFVNNMDDGIARATAEDPFPAPAGTETGQRGSMP